MVAAAGAVLGTGSARRQAQVKKYYPELEFTGIRGNVDTRLEKMKEEGLDGLILAAAGLQRLGLEERINEYLPLDEYVPAAGQATLAVEVLQEREDLISLLELLDSEEIRLASIAERRYLELMGGSCRLPLGAYARFREGEDVMELTGFLAREERDKYLIRRLKEKVTGAHAREKARRLGEKLAELLTRG